MWDGLRTAVDCLYEAFESYATLPVPLYYEGADPVGYGASLASKPLRELTNGDLDRFKWNALTTWGTPDDFRHYLPRMLELVATNERMFLDNPEVTFSQLEYAAWRDWPGTERQAIEAFCRAWWMDVTHSHPCANDPATALCCIGQIMNDLRPYLDDWQPARSRGEAIQFAGWVRDVYCSVNAKSWRRWKLRDAWWDKRPGAAQQAAEWLLAPERVTELESAFFAFGTDGETAAALSDAIDELFNVRTLSGLFGEGPRST